MKLRPIEPEDLALLYTIENDPQLWDTTAASGPYSRFALKQYIATAETAPHGSEARFVIEVDDEADGKCRAIGLADLTAYSPLHARAEVGLALLSEERNQGYGPQALQLLEQYAVERLRVHLLYAQVAGTNTIARQTFLRMGYQQQAVLPQWHFAAGKYHDLHVFAKFF